MGDKKLRFLVISDLHAIMEDEEQSDSFLVFDSSGRSSFLDGFKKFVKESDLVPDVIICSGDVSNKGSPEAFKKIWNGLNVMKEELSVELLCVPGNHDLDSRLTKEGSFDPKYELQFAYPPFPDACHINNTQFWAWHWYHSRHSLFNAVLINTSAYHGFSKEFARGRIAPKVTEKIGDHVESELFDKKSINLIICHHHPTRMEHVDSDSDYESIDGGELFLERIRKTNKGPWLVFHGHKHWPQVRSYGDDNSTIIISSGSLSANIHSGIADRATNTFCFIEVDLERTENTGNPSGRYKTFEWHHGYGWAPSKNSRMPQSGGFGSYKPPRILAKTIKRKLETDGVSFISVPELGNDGVELLYYSPDKIERLISELKALNISVTFDSEGGFDQFGEAK
jgi:predicted phosphodiesterase